MARGSNETTNFVLKIAAVLLAIAIIYILIRRHPGFINWAKGLTSGSFVGAAAAIGETKQGPNIFTVVGPIEPTDATRLSIASSGSGGPSCRDNQGFDCSKYNRETTCFHLL